ncbi:MAG: hypothetical protein QRY72_00070 [Candidatus Rhabdochlamydia sp.]
MIGSFDPLAPMHFFLLHHDVPYVGKEKEGLTLKKHQLPSTEHFLAEEPFAEVMMGWNESGLFFKFHQSKPFESCSYPQFTQGDAIELFIDTRDLKDTGFATRFCHHFLILPQQVQEIRALELSHFRGEDHHLLCNPELIGVKFSESSQDYFVEITLPAEILYGFDPLQFDRVGMTYVVHRPKGKPQHFTLSSSYLAAGQHPSFWASCKLIKP